MSLAQKPQSGKQSGSLLCGLVVAFFAFAGLMILLTPFLPYLSAYASPSAAWQVLESLAAIQRSIQSGQEKAVGFALSFGDKTFAEIPPTKFDQAAVLAEQSDQSLSIILDSNWNIFINGDLTADQIVSTSSVSSPLIVSSNKEVANLNANYLQGKTAADFLSKDEFSTVTLQPAEQIFLGTSSLYYLKGDGSGHFKDLIVLGSVSLPNDSVVDAYIPNTITASNYLPLAGGTMTGGITFVSGQDFALGDSGSSINFDEVASSGTLPDLYLETIARAGKVSDTALSSNIAKLDTAQTFSANKTFNAKAYFGGTTYSINSSGDATFNAVTASSFNGGASGAFGDLTATSLTTTGAVIVGTTLGTTASELNSVYIGSNDLLAFGDNQSAEIKYDSSSGDLEINPNAAVDASFFAEATSGENPFLYLYGYDSGAGATKYFGIQVDTSGTAQFTTSTNEDFAFDTSTLYIDTSANKVGVGTTAPFTQLEVKGNILASNSLVLGTTLNYGFYLPNDGELAMMVNGGESVVVTSSDTFGIFDTTPDAHLEVSASGTTGGAVFMVSSNDSTDGDLFQVNEDGTVSLAGSVTVSADEADLSFTGSGTHTLSATFGTLELGGFTVNGDARIASGSDLHLGSIGLTDTASAATSGAYLIGTFDEFGNSSSANVQDVLHDLDSAIASGGAGSMWTLSSSVISPSSATNDFAIGSATLVAPFSVDESTNTIRIGDGSGTNATINMYSSGNDTGSITYTPDDRFVFSNGSTQFGTTYFTGNVDMGNQSISNISTLNSYASQFLTMVGWGDSAEAFRVNFANGNGAWIWYGGASTPLVTFNDSGDGGYVGIGTSAQKNKLDVSGSVAFGNLPTTSLPIANSAYFSGNVGIGTTFPSQKLEVAGDMLVGSDAANNDDYIYFDDGTSESLGWIDASTWFAVTDDFVPGTADSFNLGGTSNEWNALYLGDDAGIYFGQDQDHHLYYDETTDDRLELSGTAFDLDLSGAFSLDSDSALTLGSTRLVYTSDLAAGQGATEAISLISSVNLGATDQLFEIGDSASDMLTILGNGNVGIGTTNPTYRLDVNGDIRIASGSDLHIGTVGLGDTASGTTSGAYLVGTYDEFAYSNSLNVQDVLDDLDASIAVVSSSAAGWTDEATTVYLTVSEDVVGIGTSTPKNRLDVSGSVAFGSLPTTALPVANSAYFSGNVGIGTTNPIYTVDINGDVRIAVGSDLHIGAVGLGDTASGSTSGAYVVGTYDEFSYSNSANVQDVLDDLDAAITTAQVWTRGSTTLSPTTNTDDVGIGGTGPEARIFLDASEGQLKITGEMAINGAAVNSAYGLSGNFGVNERGIFLQGTNATDSGDSYGLYFDNDVTGNFANNYSIYEKTDSTTNDNYTYGFYSDVDISGATGSTYSGHYINLDTSVGGSYYGLNLDFDNSAGSATKFYGLSAAMNVTGSASSATGLDLVLVTATGATVQYLYGVDLAMTMHNLDTAYGIKIVDATASSGGTEYGVFLDLDDTDVPTRWAVYTEDASANSAFLDDVFIGSATGYGSITPDGSGDLYVAGDFEVDGSAYGTFPDYAEMIAAEGGLEAGDVLVIDNSKKETVKKASSPYELGLVGIVSTNPGFVLASASGGVPMALAGRVPVKVCGQNGPIKAGDYLTSSSQPGVAMKANAKGPTIGKALEDWPNPDPSAIGKIQALVNVSWYDPGSIGTLSGSGKFEVGIENLRVENKLVSEASRILVTPTTKTNFVISVTGKEPGAAFTVSLPSPAPEPISFDYWVVN